jgi:hypothetical protein
MSDKPVWTQQTSKHFVLQRGDQSVSLHYEDAGFQSVWAVYAGDRLIGRVAEFMQARGMAMQAAGLHV